MAIAAIKMIYCVVPATGVDGPVNQEFANILGQLSGQLVGADAASVLKAAVDAIPSLMAAIDEAGAYPDDLYLTIKPTGRLENSIWPPDRETEEFQAGQSANPKLRLPFYDNLNISLWDHDVSGDDLLGSVTVLQAEANQGTMSKFAYSKQEGSAYYLVYEVVE